MQRSLPKIRFKILFSCRCVFFKLNILADIISFYLKKLISNEVPTSYFLCDFLQSHIKYLMNQMIIGFLWRFEVRGTFLNC